MSCAHVKQHCLPVQTSGTSCIAHLGMHHATGLVHAGARTCMSGNACAHQACCYATVASMPRHTRTRPTCPAHVDATFLMAVASRCNYGHIYIWVQGMAPCAPPRHSYQMGWRHFVLTTSGVHGSVPVDLLHQHLLCFCLDSARAVGQSLLARAHACPGPLVPTSHSTSILLFNGRLVNCGSHCSRGTREPA